jgi:hypothetical protein
MTRRKDCAMTSWRKAGAALTLGVLAAEVCVLTPAMVRAAGIEADAGLLSPPIANHKPINVKTGLFLTNLINVDEVKERFCISGYLFMTWKDPRLAFSPAGGHADRAYYSDSTWVPRVFLVNAVQREKTNIYISGNPDGTIHYVELFKAELTNSFYLKPFPFDTESLECSWSPSSMSATDDTGIRRAVGGVGTEPFVELVQWKILDVHGGKRRHEIVATSKTISQLQIDVVVKRRYQYYIWKVFVPLLAMVAPATLWSKPSEKDRDATRRI